MRLFYFLTTVVSALLLNSTCFAWITTKGSKLYDANGKQFVPGGVDFAYIAYRRYNDSPLINVTPDPDRVMSAIAATGSNIVRIYWTNSTGLRCIGVWPDGTRLYRNDNDVDLIRFIKAAIKNKLIVILNYASASGKSGYSDLMNAANWFADRVNILWPYRDYIILGPGDEWVPKIYLFFF